ncbi:MAG: SurA N-terminal domain-containing protein [Thermodesulfovibrionales bacterium]
MMGKIPAIVAFFIIIILTTTICLSASTVDRVLATVNDEFITLSDYRIYLKREGYTYTEGVDEGILNRMIEERLILREARKKGITSTDPEIDEMINEIAKERGVSKDELINFLKGEEKDYKD